MTYNTNRFLGTDEVKAKGNPLISREGIFVNI